jgi:hypothetical protein
VKDMAIMEIEEKWILLRSIVLKKLFGPSVG